MSKAQIKYVKPSALKPYTKNPRKNDAAVKAVARSIEEYDFQQPIIADKEGVIITGHTRWRAAKLLGLDEIPVIYADLPPDKAKAYRLVDNKTSEFSEWDVIALDDELLDLAGLGADLSAFGFHTPKAGGGGLHGIRA